MRFAASGPSSFMPPQGTDIARGFDSLYEFLLIASFVSCVLVIAGMILFVVKYRRRGESDKVAYIPHNVLLEFLWSFVPFVIFMVVFVWGWIVYYQMRTMPKNALEINVEAQKWNWSFVYKNGRRSAAEFYVPVNQDVKLLMTSQDVLHSFFVPAFRVKQDVVPGRYAALWFRANHEGIYQVFCAEYCGEQHSGMLAKIHVVSEAAFADWLSNDPYKGLDSITVGQKIFSTRCVACHTATDKDGIGPGMKDMFGRERKFADGSTQVVDENYIRESLMNPNAKIVAGFTPAMPTFAGQLNEQELMGVIDYLKSLK